MDNADQNQSNQSHCEKCGQFFSWNEMYLSSETPGINPPPGGGFWGARWYCPHCGAIVRETSDIALFVSGKYREIPLQFLPLHEERQLDIEKVKQYERETGGKKEPESSKESTPIVQQGYAALKRGALEESSQIFEKARAAGLDSHNYACALGSIGYMYLNQARNLDVAKAFEYCLRSVEINVSAYWIAHALIAIINAELDEVPKYHQALANAHRISMNRWWDTGVEQQLREKVRNWITAHGKNALRQIATEHSAPLPSVQVPEPTKPTTAPVAPIAPPAFTKTPEAAVTKKCPMCAEQIPADAVVCPYCGTRFGEDVQAAPSLPEPVPPPAVSPASMPIKKSHTGLRIAGALVIVILCGLIAIELWIQRGNLPAFSVQLATPTPTATPTLAPPLIPTIPPSPTITPSPTPGIGSTWIRPVDKMAMVFVPEGDFMMGSNGWADTMPVHTVHLDDYWIDQTEVTNAMYALFEPGSRGPDDHPVVLVSWNNAAAYCAWAGARLPTEAEWEKAARGTDGQEYPWGNEAASCSLANFYPCVVATARVGSSPEGASPYMAYDLAGNADEWVNDWYDASYYKQSPASNPQGPDSGSERIFRGGAWNDNANLLHSSIRYKVFQNSFSTFIGFRCARDAGP